MRIGVGLSIPELATRGGRAFSPASLFTSGVQGTWYDPSDYSTLFQDSAGTTPVTAVEQPVGLMLDKSQGLVLGPELITNGDFNSATGWLTTNSASVSGGKGIVSGATGAALLYQASGLVSGRWYKATFDIDSITGTLNIWDNSGNVKASFTTTGSKTAIFLHSIANGNFLFQVASGASIATIDNVSVKELAGNHASQATAASRPVLRARYNLLTYSEQFDNAAWTKTDLNTTGTPAWVNVAVAPDGTTTADKLIPNTSNTTTHRVTQSITVPAGAAVILIYVKADGYSKFYIREGATTGAYAAFDLSAVSVLSQGTGTGSIVASSNGWYLVSLSFTAATSARVDYGPLDNGYTTGLPTLYSYAGNGTSGVLIWGADLRTGSSAGTYQRIAAATDYATAGFLPYLYFVTDDSFATGSIDFSATDKMSVCAGVTKLSDATLGMLVELGNGSSADFFLAAPRNTATADYAFRSRGTLPIEATSPAAYAAPITNVLTGIGNISGDVCALRVNGTQVAQSTGDQGTGNYSNSPLYIGRRGGSTLPLNGNVYQLIVCGKTLSASELASTESFVAAKTGVAI